MTLIDLVRFRRMRPVRLAIPIVLGLLALVPLGVAIGGRWFEFKLAWKHLAWGSASLSLLLFILIIAFMGVIPWVSLRSMGVPFSQIRAVAVYFLSQVPKYLPGGFWAIPGRVALYVSLGVDLPLSVVSVFRETTAIYLGAALVAFMGVFLDLSMSIHVKYIIGVGVGVSAIIVTLTHIPRVWARLSEVRILDRSPLRAYRDIESRFANLRWLPGALLVSVLFWLLLGLPFRILIEAVVQKELAASWLMVSSLFATAWCVGFVIVVVPAGIGIRESVFAFLLSFSLDHGEALSVAVLSRLWWILGEAIWIVAAVIILSRDIEIRHWLWGRSDNSLT